LTKEADGVFIQIGLALLQTDQYIPADLLRQVQHRGLSVQSVEQEDSEERAAKEIRKSAEQPHSRGLLIRRLRRLHRKIIVDLFHAAIPISANRSRMQA
jgi:hypothetical protein